MLVIYLAMIDEDEQRSKFEVIYKTYFGMMYKIAYTITKDQNLAEDAVHETMLAIIENIDSIRIDNFKELKSYIYIVTKSKTIDFLRKWEKRKTTLYPSDDVPPDIAVSEPDEIALTNIVIQRSLQALQEMPEKYRIALIMKVKGYTIKDISRLTNTTEANVKNRIYRARQHILNKIK